MKTSQFFFFLGYILIIGLITSCTLDDSSAGNDSTGNNELAYNIARALSADSALEDEIIYKVCHKFDGDYSILFRYLSPEFAKCVPEIANTSYKGYELELKMPMASMWSLDEIESAGGLVVATVPFDVDDNAITRLIGYQKNGKKVIITKENYRTIPYILISSNERVSKEGMIMYGPNEGCHVNDIYFSPISKTGHMDRSIKLGFINKEDIPVTLYNLHNNPQILYNDNPAFPECRASNVPTSPPTPTPTPTAPPIYLFSRVGSYSNEIKVLKKTDETSTPDNKPTITWKQIHIKKGLDDDGWPHWLDGDLELEFKLYQSLLQINVNLETLINFNGTVSFEYRDFYIYKCEHDWDKTKTYNVDFTESLTMLQSFQIPFTDYYLFNKKLRLKVTELDNNSSNEVYLNTDFNIDLFFNEYNDKWKYWHNKIGFLFSADNYLFLC
ncbi:MAG: hypothetical protein JXB88_18195 [Spirochaetales bacterium]|nr:hypothetical protein [Spirochaetales bacterium]